MKGEMPALLQPSLAKRRVCCCSVRVMFLGDDSVAESAAESAQCLWMTALKPDGYILLPGRAGREAHSNYDFPFGTNLTPFPLYAKT